MPPHCQNLRVRNISTSLNPFVYEETHTEISLFPIETIGNALKWLEKYIVSHSVRK